MPGGSLFDRIEWRDPLSHERLEPFIVARNPWGSPIWGALRRPDTSVAYPIVDGIARLTPEVAAQHAEWIQPLGFEPPRLPGPNTFQTEATVDSFGFQWNWNPQMRSESDLNWRVADRFRIPPSAFAGKRVLDAGSGSGDQSRWLLDHGAEVVSIDLSRSIDAAGQKLRTRDAWVGVQGDITVLPFADRVFDIVYCEGVIQHTRDSSLTVGELCRVLRRGGRILASHYAKPSRTVDRLRAPWHEFLRANLSPRERYSLLWITGTLAALAKVPVLGFFLTKTGTVPFYKLMPDYKTTWTNTYDLYGGHSFHRLVSWNEFWEFFASTGSMELSYRDPHENVIVASKTAD